MRFLLFLLLTVTTIVFFDRISDPAPKRRIGGVPKPLPWPQPQPRPECPGVEEEPPAPVVPTASPIPAPDIDFLGGSNNGGVQVNWAGLSGTGIEAGWLSDEGISLGLRRSFLLDNSWQGFVSGGLFLDEEDTTETTTVEGWRGKHKHRHKTTTTYINEDTNEFLRPYGQAGINYLIDSNWKVGLLYRHNFVGDESSCDKDAVMLSLGVSF